ncbi:MAG: hypothetical protein ACK4UN_06310 [Limisphaerales bacterium]
MNPAKGSEPLTEITQTENVDLLKWVISRNPFYIMSAVFLLFAVYRLSVDPRMFATEVGQLFFNFGSFQFYELLLVGTAIFLARRQIWDDSSMLVVLESLFVLVPFILISQALLIESHMAAAFCVVAFGLAVARYGSIKKFLPNINLPTRLLLLGAGVLMINLALPLVVRMLHHDTNMVVWETRGAAFYSFAWFLLVPALLAVTNVLPPANERGDILVQRGFFPVALFATWVVGTAVHLYSIGYVYGLKWNLALAIPVLWVTAWTVRNRVHDFGLMDEELQADQHDLLLLPGAAVPLMAAFLGEWTMFLVLTGLNAILFGYFTVREQSKVAFHLLLLSGAMMLAGLPRSLFEGMQVDVSRSQIIWAAVLGYLVFRSVLSRNPRLGILGALITGVAGVILFRNSGYPADIGGQMAILFLMVHSLRWIDVGHEGAKGLRIVLGVTWIAHSLIWLGRGGDVSLYVVLSFALVVIGLYALVKLIFGFWGSRVVICSALLVLACKPLLFLCGLVKDAPVGVLALGVSFALFGLGTAAALVKNRFTRNERTLPVTTQINTTL